MKKSLSFSNKDSNECNSPIDKSDLKKGSKCRRSFSLRGCQDSVKNGFPESNREQKLEDSVSKSKTQEEDISLTSLHDDKIYSESIIEGFAILEFNSEDDLMKYVDSCNQQNQARIEDTVKKSNRKLRSLKINADHDNNRVNNDLSITDHSSCHSTRPGSRTSPDPYHFDRSESMDGGTVEELRHETTLVERSAVVDNHGNGRLSEDDSAENLITPKSPLRVVCPGDHCFSFGPSSHQSLPPHVSPVTSLSPRVRPGPFSNNGGNSGPPTLKSEKVSPPAIVAPRIPASSPRSGSSLVNSEESQFNKNTGRLKKSSTPQPSSDQRPKPGSFHSQFSVASLAQSDSYLHHSSSCNPVTNPSSTSVDKKHSPPVANYKRNTPSAGSDTVKPGSNQVKTSHTKSSALSNGVTSKTPTVSASHLPHSQSYISQQSSSANPFSIRAPSPAISLATQQYPPGAWQHPFASLPTGFTRKCASPSGSGLNPASSHHPLIGGPDFYRSQWENNHFLAAQTSAALLASSALPGSPANFLRNHPSGSTLHGLPSFPHPNSLPVSHRGLGPSSNNDFSSAAALLREAGAHQQSQQALQYMRGIAAAAAAAAANGVSGASSFVPGFGSSHSRLSSNPSLQTHNPHCVAGPLNLSQPDMMGLVNNNSALNHSSNSSQSSSHLSKPVSGKARRWCNMHVQIANYIHKCEKSKKSDVTAKQGSRLALSNPTPRTSSQSSVPLSQARTSSSDKGLSQPPVGPSNTKLNPFHHNPAASMFPPSYLLPQDFLSQTRPNLPNHLLPGGLPLPMPAGMSPAMWPHYPPFLERDKSLQSQFAKFSGRLQAAHSNIGSQMSGKAVSPTSTNSPSYHPSDPKKRRIMNSSQPTSSQSSSRRPSTSSQNNSHHSSSVVGLPKKNGTTPSTTISPPLNLSSKVVNSKSTVSNNHDTKNHSTAYHSVNSLIDNNTGVRSDSVSSSQRASSSSSNPLSVTVIEESSNNLVLNGSVNHVSPKSASNYDSGAKYEIKT